MTVKTLLLLFATFVGVILSEVTDEPWQSESSTSSYDRPTWALRVQTRFFREKCEENGLSDAFFEVEKAIKEAHVCYRSAIYNMEKPRPEHTTSRSDYAISSIKGYCANTPELEECYDLLAEGVLPCLTAEEKHQLDSWLDAWHQLLEFMCFKEAERPSRFIADGGLACMDTYKNELKECTDGLSDILERWTPEIVMMDSAFEEVQEEQCAKVMALKDCVLAAIGRCGRPTITDFAVSTLDIVIRGMPCDELMEPATDRNLNGSIHDELMV